MLFFDFKNYEEFKEIFGIIKHGNGVKSRKNRILLSLYKDRYQLRNHIKAKVASDYHSLWEKYSDRRNRRLTHKLDNVRDTVLSRFYWESYSKLNHHTDLLRCTNVTTLKNTLFSILLDSTFSKAEARYMMNLMGKTFFVSDYETDDMHGICEDGTVNAIRYVNLEKKRVFKMKAGRMFNHILACNMITCDAPEQIKRWLSEEFVADWIQHVKQNTTESNYKLHVNDNFEDIYDSSICDGNFHSCMVNEDQWTFYRDAVKAKAAYLTDENDYIVARCIIFTDVEDTDGNTYRLAERQYSKESDLDLQRQLVNALIRGGHIDGYKRVGSSCHEGTAYVSNSGEDWSDKRFQIDCDLDTNSTLSYQDSFKYYDMSERIAYNYNCGSCIALDITNETIEDNREWSSYNDEYIDSDEAYWVSSREDYFYSSQVVTAKVWNSYCARYEDETCFKDDCVNIEGTYYYAGEDAESPEDNYIYKCPNCGEYYVSGESYYSDITEEDYCCSYCRDVAEKDYKENNWTYSEYDDEYYEDSDDVIRALEWNVFDCKYDETTISIDSFNSLVEDGEATEFCGTYYLDSVKYDGEPEHLLHADRIAA